MRFLQSDNLSSFFGRVAELEKLYIPANNSSGKSAYTLYRDGVEFSKNLNTSRSAKDFFFPQTENLVAFKMVKHTIEIIDPRVETEDFCVFGVRACDARSFKILDKVFLSDPVDTYYQNRREHGTIITMSCTRPSETCFCTAFGINPAEPEGDINFLEVDGGYAVEAFTEKGEKLLSAMEDVFGDVAEEKAADTKAKIAEITAKMPLTNLDLSEFGGGKTKDHFNSQLWASLSEACLGCGTCTFVCPTCQCYDIKDFDTGHGVQRFRCWDSCMYSDFTKMAHGNPRLSQKERFRQRFMHKLVYFPENNNGEFGCVGCGRCLNSCPASINIVKVIKRFTEADND